jgi:hypothetical protein
MASAAICRAAPFLVAQNIRFHACDTLIAYIFCSEKI